MNRRGFLGTVAAVAAGGCFPKPLTLTEVAAFMHGVESAPYVPPIGSAWSGCVYSEIWAAEFDGTADHTQIRGASTT